MSGVGASLQRDLDLIARSATVAGLGDAELLARFASGGEGGGDGDGDGDGRAGAAFEAIVARHGPMVLATCRRSLNDPSGTDDAFQATFLVLVKRAGHVRVGESLGPWLHGVATRVAAKARGKAARRREVVGPPADLAARPGDDPEVAAIVREEVARLPAAYRSAVVLCHFQGLTHAEAAKTLRWRVGTLSGRLSRARSLLRDRLARRGLGLSSAAIVGALTTEAEAVSPARCRATAEAAIQFASGGGASPLVLSLTKGTLMAMTIGGWKMAGLGLVGVGFLAIGASRVIGQGQPGRPETPPAATAVPVAKPTEALDLKDVDQAVWEAHKKFEAKLRVSGGVVPTVANESMVLAGSADGQSIRAMIPGAVAEGEAGWKVYRAPEGTRVVPMLVAKEAWTQGRTLGAPGFSGPAVREVAVFDGAPRAKDPDGNAGAGGGDKFSQVVDSSGRWVVLALREPIRGPVVPVDYKGAVVYQAGREILAYAPGGAWTRLALSAEDPVSFRTTPAGLLVQDGELLHVYANGRWIRGDSPTKGPAAK